MARPMPLPLTSAALRPRKNRWDTCGSSSAGMPTPVSLTRSIARSPEGHVSRTTWPPDGVNLAALVSRFVTTSRILARSQRA